jgi:hypothetical protein
MPRPPQPCPSGPKPPASPAPPPRRGFRMVLGTLTVEIPAGLPPGQHTVTVKFPSVRAWIDGHEVEAHVV